MKQKSDIPFVILLLSMIFALFCLNLGLGDVKIDLANVFHILGGGEAENPSWSYIIESRLNRSIAAIFAGGALGVSGLILQVFFRNPLAGPGVLGITSGASLGVAFILLGGATMGSFLGGLGIVIAGVIGALAVLVLLLIISRFIYNSITLLVAGLMFGYFTSALINIFSLWANESDTREFVVWGLGSFDGFANPELVFFVIFIFFTVFLSLVLVKPLNALVAGTDYALSIGINLKRARVLIILITGILAAIVTIFCGPISFIGIAVPQFIRLFVRSRNHALIIPIVFLGGGLLALLADFVVRMSSNSLPLNTVTAVIGAPIIIGVIVKMNRKNAGI